jgi:hypothetical protein
MAKRKKSKAPADPDCLVSRYYELAPTFCNFDDWIHRLQANGTAASELALLWREMADIFSGCMYDFDGGFTVPDAGDRESFSFLTDILAAWCDASKRPIDPVSLLRSRNILHSFPLWLRGEVPATYKHAPADLKRDFADACQHGIATCQQIALRFRTPGKGFQTRTPRRKDKTAWTEQQMHKEAARNPESKGRSAREWREWFAGTFQHVRGFTVPSLDTIHKTSAWKHFANDREFAKEIRMINNEKRRRQREAARADEL